MERQKENTLKYNSDITMRTYDLRERNQNTFYHLLPYATAGGDQSSHTIEQGQNNVRTTERQI